MRLTRIHRIGGPGDVETMVGFLVACILPRKYHEFAADAVTSGPV